MKKSDLKSLINECIVEVLAEEQEREAIIAEISNLSLKELKTLHEGFFSKLKTQFRQGVGAAEGGEAAAIERVTKSYEEAIKKDTRRPQPGTPEYEEGLKKALKLAKTNAYEGEYTFEPKSKTVQWKGKPTVGSAGGSGVQLENNKK